MRTTITINDKLFRSLKLRAVDSDTSVSAIVEDAVKYQILEDFEDIEDAQKRANEQEYSFNDLVNQYRAEGLL
ncbi:MAG: CopG family transcriptional regulator [Candidatus Saccharibacteria bacterium]